MFLPTLGLNRDRTGDLFQFRSNGLPLARDISDSVSLLKSASTVSQTLDPFFQLASDIKTQLNQVKVSQSELLRAQQQCLRPTFLDSRDEIRDVVALESSISMKLDDISRKINLIRHHNGETSEDRMKILLNLKLALEDMFREATFTFKSWQQVFYASYNRRPEQELDPTEFDVSTIDVGLERQQDRIIREERETVEQLARRAEEIRSLFIDLATLIGNQGSVVDRIDVLIGQTLDNVNKAGEEVEKAARHQKKSRLWFIVLILAVLVASLLLYVIVK
jgi:hypothetical protein